LEGVFVELTFAEPPGLPQTYTTQLFITPSNAPFPLDQPIDNPRSAFFWTLEFEAALGDAYRYSPTFDAETLQGFLPVRVFDQYISTLDEARAALKFRGNLKHRALRQCLAVRLNIEAEKLDWYSPVHFFFANGKTFLWKRWNKAHRAFLKNKPRIAALNCAALNFQ